MLRRKLFSPPVCDPPSKLPQPMSWLFPNLLVTQVDRNILYHASIFRQQIRQSGLSSRQTQGITYILVVISHEKLSLEIFALEIANAGASPFLDEGYCAALCSKYIIGHTHF